MPTEDSDRRITEVLELAGLDPHDSPSGVVRGILEKINSQPLPQIDAEFARLLQQLGERSG